MKVCNFNINGWSREKSNIVNSLTIPYEVLCLAETWNASGASELPTRVQTYNCMAPSTDARYRRGGGVSILVNANLPSRQILCISTQSFQLLAVSVQHTLIVGACLLPSTPKSSLIPFFDHLRRYTRGSCILLGNFNARHTDLDRSTNPHGTRLRRWA